jgi:hypothetical protein
MKKVNLRKYCISPQINVVDLDPEVFGPPRSGSVFRHWLKNTI